MSTTSHHQLLLATAASPVFSSTDKGAGITLSGLGQSIATGISGWNSVRGASARSTGKFWYEIEYTVGIASGANVAAVIDNGTELDNFFGAAFGTAFTAFSNNTFGTVGNITSAGFTFTNTPVAGNKVIYALDMTLGKGWIKLSTDSGWAGGGDPAAGTTPAFTWVPPLVLFPGSSVNGAGTKSTLNVGQISPTNTVPSGFTAWGYQLYTVTDPLYSSVASLLHFEGSNGGTVFNDQLGIVWTPTGATTSTTQVKFGSTSGSFNGTQDSTQQYLTSGSNIALGGSDLTIEAWVFLTAFPPSGGAASIFDTRPVGTTGAYLAIGINASGGLRINSNAIGQLDQTTGTLLTLNTWNHVALVRRSGTFYPFLKGIATTAWTDGTSFTSNRAIIGGSGFALSGSGTRPWNGYIDEFRISIGTGIGVRYQGKSGTGINFIPYNAAFQNA